MLIKPQRQLQSKGVSPEDIIRIDIITGGDHGKGTFVAGARIVVALDEQATSEGKKIDSFSFEISVAEIICRKDNADILSKTIKDELTKGLDTLASNKLHFFLNDEGKIDVSLGDAEANSISSLKPNMYIVGDLAFYGMILGKESMSGTHCHLCKLPASKFKDLLTDGDKWAYAEMKELAIEYENENKPNKKPKFGIKSLPWFSNSIPLENFVVPLLHCLIGVGNDIFSKFRDIVSEMIEYIGDEEAQTRGARVAMDEKITGLVAQRVMFDLSPAGKRLDSLKNKERRAKKSLKTLGVMESNPVSCNGVSPYQSKLDEIIHFIENEVVIDEEEDDEEDADEEDDDATRMAAASALIQLAEDEAVSAKIKEVEEIVSKCKLEIDTIQKERSKISTLVTRARSHLKTLREKIKVFKSERKRSGDGIETKMFNVLKTVYGVKIQAYHGGSLTGKDIQKLMQNSGEIFSIFATILKENKKANCTFTLAQIDELCHRFGSTCVLWDGAFSYASTINPSNEDIAWYERFVKAAVHSHVGIECNITPKVHLMWKHVAHQMRTIPGGLGNKREDWVEHLHQITSVKRKQFNHCISKEVRANALENILQQETDPRVVAFEQECVQKTSRGARKEYMTAEEERRKKRMVSRMRSLLAWENAFSGLPIPGCTAGENSGGGGGIAM